MNLRIVKCQYCGLGNRIPEPPRTDGFYHCGSCKEKLEDLNPFKDTKDVHHFTEIEVNLKTKSEIFQIASGAVFVTLIGSFGFAIGIFGISMGVVWGLAGEFITRRDIAEIINGTLMVASAVVGVGLAICVGISNWKSRTNLWRECGFIRRY